MERQSKIWPVTLAALISIAGVQAGCAQTSAPAAPAGAQPAPAAAARPLQTTAAPAVRQPVAGQPAAEAAAAASTASAENTENTATPAEKAREAGDVAELQRLIRGTELAELRTTYNGSYGASLLFDTKTETYYAALFHRKTFWRVIKTTDSVRAESVYRDFERQTVQLSDVEIRRIQLDAQKAHLEQLISQSETRIERMKSDLAVARQQQQLVADQQKQTRDEANSLSAENSASRGQLQVLERQLRDLQREVNTGLPAR